MGDGYIWCSGRSIPAEPYSYYGYVFSFQSLNQSTVFAINYFIDQTLCFRYKSSPTDVRLSISKRSNAKAIATSDRIAYK